MRYRLLALAALVLAACGSQKATDIPCDPVCTVSRDGSCFGGATCEALCAPYCPPSFHLATDADGAFCAPSAGGAPYPATSCVYRDPPPDAGADH